MQNFPLEPDVRLQVDERLKNLGWSLSGPKKNVFLEQPKTEGEKQKLGGKRPDYVLYEKGKDNPLIVIETKKKGSNIQTALDQGIHYAKVLQAPIVFATDGVFYKSLHTQTQKPLYLNGEEVDELIRELIAIQYLESGTYELDTIPKEVQLGRQELINIFDEANNALRVEGLRAGIERFSEFANILFLKLFSEIDDQRDSQIDRKLKWNFYKNKPADEILDYINDTVLQKISKIYKDDNIFSPLQIRDGRVLKKIIDKLDPLPLIDINSDIKGDAFEYFLKATTATGNDLGEYFTPRHIVKMMVKLINPQITEKIYDPFCGTGGLLIESFRHIYNTMPRNERNLETLRKKTIYGNEITNTARITKMNMILAGDGHSNIKMKNSLADPFEVESKFDVVLTNMPYSQTTDFGALYDIPTRNGDSICVQHCIKAVDKSADNGRIAIVVPEGFLFRKDLQKTREYLLEKCVLKSIISLPQGVFLPYTGVKTNILYLTKVKQAISQSHYWYFDVKNDGYTLDNNRRKLEGESDIEVFLANRKVDNTEKRNLLSVGFSIIDLEEVRQHSYILSANRYRRQAEHSTTEWEIVKVQDICDKILGGGTPSTTVSDYWKGNIPWITSSDIVDLHKIEPKRFITDEAVKNSTTNLIPKNNVIVATRVGLGKLTNNHLDVCISQDLQGLILKKDIANPKYITYVLSKAAQSFIEESRGSTIQGVTKAQLAELSIPLPPLKEQEQIVQQIDSYFSVIEANKASIESYKTHISPHKDWPIIELGTVCSFSGGTQPPKSTFIYKPQKGYIRLLQIRDYKSDDNAVYIPITERHKTCHEEDVMIGRYGPPVFQILRGKAGAYNVALIKCIIDKKKITSDWLFYFLSSDSIQKYIIGLSERSRQSGVSPTDLKKLKIPLPSIDVQNTIVNEIKEEQSLISANKRLLQIFERKISETINRVWGV